MKIVVLGGAGGVGSVAVRALATQADVTELVVADVRVEAAEKVVQAVGRAGMKAAAFDAFDKASLAAVMAGADCVLNCVGPFYKFGPPILRAAIAAKVRYVDICDDLAPTREMLTLDAEAKAAGVPALIGMGNSPGLANLFVALCSTMLMEKVEGVDIMHIHGGEPEEGAAVIKHRIFAMLNDIPLFLDGKFENVRQLEESGKATTVETTFRDIGTFPVYPYPHPETITLPTFLPGLKRATNLGVIFPLSYFHLTQDMVRAGTCGDQPMLVNGQPVVPIDFAVAHILSRRDELLREAGVTGPGGCLKVVVDGIAGGEPNRFVFSLSSQSAGAGEGTGIPAAAGAVMMARGEIPAHGVYPPEAVPNPFGILLLTASIAKVLGSGGKESIHVERIDAAGVSHAVPLPL